MGAHHRLGDLCLQCGRVDVVLTPQHETSQRQDPDADGLLTETQRATAEAEYRAWVRDQALSQTMYLIAVEGRRPASTLYQYHAI